MDALRSKKQNEKSRSSSSSSSSSSSTSTSSRSFPNNAGEKSHVSSTTRSDSLESRNSGGYERARAIPGARRSELDMQRDLLRLNDLIKPGTVNVKGTPHIEVQPPYEKDAIISSQQQQQQHLITDNSGNIQTAGVSSNHSMRLPPSRRKNSNSSTLTSLRDDPEVQVSPSVESTDWRNFIRSESQNSVPSWASSISLDCRAGEEPIKEFMKRFTETLFHSANTIDLESKSEFGALIRLDIGRQWFTRFLLEQKNKSKRIEELTFHLLVQHFAIFLFECSECEDYPPAAIVMNLCFVFYREGEILKSIFFILLNTFKSSCSFSFLFQLTFPVVTRIGNIYLLLCANNPYGYQFDFGRPHFWTRCKRKGNIAWLPVKRNAIDVKPKKNRKRNLKRIKRN